MPISPKEIADARLESTITRLCDLIDTKLRNSEKLPFEFTFLPDTSYEVCTKIAEIYRQVGWSATLVAKDNKNVLTLTTYNAIDTSALNYIQNTDCVLSDTTDIVKDAMSEESGRIAIAHAMKEPILTSLKFQSLLRRIFMIDLLEPTQLPNYDIDVEYIDNAFYLNNKREIEPYHYIDDTVRFLEIASSTIYSNTYNKYEIDKSQVKISDSLKRQEDNILVKLLQEAAKFEQTIYTYPQTLDIAILDSMGEIESQELIAAKLILHPMTYRKMFTNGDMFSEFNQPSQKDILMLNLYGNLYGMDVHVTNFVPSNEIFITPPAQFFGSVAVREELSVLPMTQKKINESESKYGFAAYTTMFPVVLYPKTVRKIVVRL